MTRRWHFPERVRSVLADAFAHHWTELLQFQRHAFLKGQGMDHDQQVTRFPPSSTVINHGVGLGKTLLTAAAGAAALYFLGPRIPFFPPQPQPQSQETRPAEPAPAPVAPAAKIQLFYDDPQKGLIPISGAADEQGAPIRPGK